jgi:putative PIN family toxin of toxin-antitoxin system
MPPGKSGGGVKVVVDTNTLVSGLLWRGNPSRILDAILDNHLELYLSEELLAELREVLCRPRLAKFVEARGLKAVWSCDFIGDRSVIVSLLANWKSLNCEIERTFMCCAPLTPRLWTW